MRVLVIGSGGREHALAWKAAQSPLVDRVFAAPGNAGTALEPKVENVPIGADQVQALLQFAREKGVDLSIVGPEAPLVAGIGDAFESAGLRCFAPVKDAARLEGSKAFAKAFMQRHGIPTAAFESFTELDEALAYLRDQSAPQVIKADGLAGGKGVVVCDTPEEAEQAVRSMLAEDRFGAAGKRIVIEERLQGEEASVMVLAGPGGCVELASSQDHKALNEGDTGPNTGGMGAYSPAPVVDEAMRRRILDEVMHPVLRGMAREGVSYSGFLYAGLMISPQGEPKVLEFNVRLGDPETQPLMMRLESDLVALINDVLDGNQASAHWDPRPCLGVVMASQGYPGSYEKGVPITGLDTAESRDVKIFHAGTAARDGQIVTAGGRVLCVCALGDSLNAAQQKAYDRVRTLDWAGVYYREDIGHRALVREA